MNLQQLHCVRETVRQGLDLTAAAQALLTSRPGISKHIRELEEELGIDIFVRRGKQAMELTEPGLVVVRVIDRLLAEEDNLRRIGKEFAEQDEGALVVATTHTQARFVLPRVVQAFRSRYPRVRLSLEQSSPQQAAELVRAGKANVAIATEALDRYADLAALPAYSWSHCVIVPQNHPLAGSASLTLEDLSKFPLITYSSNFTGRPRIDEAFRARGLPMDVVLTALDADVIKTYTELGLGVGIIAGIAFDPDRDRPLVAMDARHLFGINTTRIAVMRSGQLRGYTYAFIHVLASHLTAEVIDAARRR